jgi:AraC-like DNA-binding protein
MTTAPGSRHPGPVLSESVAHRVPAPLRPLVAGVTGYRHEGLVPSVHRGLPSPFLTLVLPLDEPLVVVAHPDPGQPGGAYDALVGGLHTRPALIGTGTRQHGIQLALTPAGARALLGVPPAALASVDAELADVLGPVAAELTDRVRTAEGWAGRFAALDEVLTRIARPRPPSPEVAEAWRLTAAAGGRVRVAALARHVGWSDRRLRERFRTELGLSPRDAVRVARFDRARRRLARAVAAGTAVDLAEFAVTAGYADQAHLTREWRRLAGLPPRRWLAEEQMLGTSPPDRRSVQDTGAPDAPRWSA